MRVAGEGNQDEPARVSLSDAPRAADGAALYVPGMCGMALPCAPYRRQVTGARPCKGRGSCAPLAPRWSIGSLFLPQRSQLVPAPFPFRPAVRLAHLSVPVSGPMSLFDAWPPPARDAKPRAEAADDLSPPAGLSSSEPASPVAGTCRGGARQSPTRRRRRARRAGVRYKERTQWRAWCRCACEVSWAGAGCSPCRPPPILRPGSRLGATRGRFWTCPKGGPSTSHRITGHACLLPCYKTLLQPRAQASARSACDCVAIDTSTRPPSTMHVYASVRLTSRPGALSL